MGTSVRGEGMPRACRIRDCKDGAVNDVVEALVPRIDLLRAAPRLCLFANYHPENVVADYVLFYLRDLKAAGFRTLVVSTSDLPESEQTKLVGCCDGLLLRENVGLDIAGWAEACAMLFPIRAELLLLCNDSVYGPLRPVGDFVEELCRQPADFYGAVSSCEIDWHLQSWFRLFRPAAYNSEAFAALMLRPLPPARSKLEIIFEYEVGLSRRLREAGFRPHAAYRADRANALSTTMPFNPTYVLWKQLVERYRVPFLKVDLLRDNRFGGRGVRAWSRLVERHRPELLPLIRHDLSLRRADWSGRWLLRSYARPDRIYRPELRPIIRVDDRLGGKAGRLLAPAVRAAIHTVQACVVAARRAKRLGRVASGAFQNCIGRKRNGWS